ncbi:MAG: chloride channel protein [Candidatus Omnitrophica bacterium]|nr:chloride channel protein [Candidatus Omnitrophota bacterium]
MRTFTEILRNILRYLHKSQFIVPVILSALVGLVTGLAAVVFVWLIDQVHELFFGKGAALLSFMGGFNVMILPALGGILVALVFRFWCKEAQGDGVPEVMAAVVLKQGRMSYRVAAAKLVASALAIGSGASVGREGPIIQIGSALGSYLGRWLRLGPSRVKNLIACGAAGGIAATFHAPIAGVMFAVEVILRDFAAPVLGGVVIASVAASIISTIFLGSSHTVVLPDYLMVHPLEILFYALLGLITALLARFFMVSVVFTEKRFEQWKVPVWAKLGLGGLLVGGIGVYFPEVLSSGYSVIEDVLHGRILGGILLLLVFAKIFATSVSLGSGTSGGAFAPALFIGAVAGGAFGTLVHTLAPHITGEPGAYALVGMAACFAGIAHAPITSLLIVFEMTDGYQMILPLMVASVIATTVSQLLSRESVYTARLHSRGIELDALRSFNLTDTILVEEAMSTDVPTVPRSMKVHDLLRLFDEKGREAFSVEDDDGNLNGIVTLREAQFAAIEGDPGLILAEDILHKNTVVCYSDETLNDALKYMGRSDINQLPVVERTSPKHIVGMLTRADIVRAYSRTATQHDQLLGRVERLKAHGPEMRYLEFTVPRRSAVADVLVKDLGLPGGCTLASVNHDGRIVVPRGDTPLQPGDEVVSITTPQGEADLRAWAKERGIELTDAQETDN